MQFTSHPVFPNPLSPSAIEFTTSDECTVTLELFDEGGAELRTLLLNRAYGPGTHQVGLDPLNLAPGKYFYRFSVTGCSGEAIETRMFERIP